ncbi:hypothetical protein FJY63_12220, partial [Candidatus Sumerlaeota bacterium]|nr:hypothetical protein [Candidatus Sumerlaeota bacterium]
NPSSPTLRGSYDTPGDAVGVYVSGNLAYVAEYRGGLLIVDVTNPTSPQLRGSFRTPVGYASGVFVSGDLAYVADRGSAGGLWILQYTGEALSAARWRLYR